MPTTTVQADLVSNVDLLCLDAGNTVIFLDHERLADILREACSFIVDASTLVRTEGEAKRLAESGALVDMGWAYEAKAGARGWGKMVGTIVHRAGLPLAQVPELLRAAWEIHAKKNLWCKVPAGLGPALDAIRERGVKVAIISNSEGMLDGLFRDLGVRGHFDAIVDSGIVGVEKPDPRIFAFALDQFGVSPACTLHLGDVFATDVLGARAAGIRCALIDPFGHYEGVHPDVPRVPGAVEVARAILEQSRERED